VGFIVKKGVVLLVARIGDLFDFGIDVAVADEKIKPTVVVIIEETAAEAENVSRGSCDSGRIADFIEIALA